MPEIREDSLMARLASGLFRLLSSHVAIIFVSALAIIAAMPKSLLQPLVIDLSNLSRQSIATLLATLAMLGAVSLMALSGLSRRVFLDDDSNSNKGKPDERDVNEAVRVPSALDFYGRLAADSRSVARTLFSRSGVYLIVGVLTAVFGIVLFLSARGLMAPPTYDPKVPQIEYAVGLLQNAGILVISELIAFFFLRQSRSVLDEFRSADSIARHREEVLSLLMFSNEIPELSLTEILQASAFFSKGPRLSAGETTEIVEGRKLEKTEIDLLASIAQILASNKK